VHSTFVPVRFWVKFCDFTFFVLALLMLWFAWALLWSLMFWFGERFDLECGRARARASCLGFVVGLSAPTWTTWGVPLMGRGALWRDNQQSTFAHIHTSSSHSSTSPWSPIPYPHCVSTESMREYDWGEVRLTTPGLYWLCRHC